MNDNNSIEQQKVHLSFGEISALIQLYDLAVEDGSPLIDYVEVKEQVSRTDLKKRELDGIAWRDALAVLAAPKRQVRMQIPAPDESFTAIYYGPPSSTNENGKDALVGCWLEEDGLRVSFPWTHDQILAMGWQVVLSTIPPEADNLSLTLGLPGLTALLAAVDSLRSQLFQSNLNRETGITPLLTKEGLIEQLKLGLVNMDARWLVTLLNLFGSPYFQLAPQAMPVGMAELEAVGLLTGDELSWQPSQELLRLALQWYTVLPAFALESLEVDANGTLQQYGYHLIIRGDGPLWRIEYGKEAWQAEPKITLKGIDPDDCFDGLAQLLATPPAVPKPPQSTTEAAFDTTIVSKLTKIPKQQLSPRRVCPHCQQPIGAKAKFCKSCGQSVVMKPVEPPQQSVKPRRVCSHCQEPIGAEAKFCRSCGKSTQK